jgi:hypothetical protein
MSVTHAELLAAIRVVNECHDLGDAVYDLRDNIDWEAENARDARRYHYFRNAGTRGYTLTAQALLWGLEKSSRRKLDEAVDVALAAQEPPQ